MATLRNKVGHSTVLEAGPFGDEIIGSLVWFLLSEEFATSLGLHHSDAQL